MSKAKFILKPMKGKFNVVARSFSQVSFSKILSGNRQESRIEKEFDTIGEEASVQSIQSPVVKRDKSVDHVGNLPEYPDNVFIAYRTRITQLEGDLSNVRGEYIRILDDKVKIEKELMGIKIKNREIEDIRVKDTKRICELEEIAKKYVIQENRCKELNDMVLELSGKLEEICGKAEKQYEENEIRQKQLEDRVQRLIKENIVYKSELHSRDEYCENLKREISSLKALPKDYHEKAAVKNLSYIILSKSKSESKPSSDPAVRLKDLELAYTNLQNLHESSELKSKSLIEWTHCIYNLIKSKNFLGAYRFIESKSIDFSLSEILNASKSSTEHSGPLDYSEMESQQFRIKKLEDTIESLEIKLEISHCSTDFINYMQCQAAIIEDYLNEDTEISIINSSMFSY